MSLDTMSPISAISSRVDIKRVAHFTDTYLPRRDGVVTSLHTLLDGLQAEGCSGLIVAPRHPDYPDHEGLLTVRSVPIARANFRLATWPRNRDIERVAAWGPQLIHVHSPLPVGLLGMMTAQRLGLPLVQTYHTDLHAYADAYRVPAMVVRVMIELYSRKLHEQLPPVVKGGSRRHAILDAAFKVLFSGTNAVVVPTPAVLARAPLPVPPERVFLVPTGVPQREVSPDAIAAFRARYNLSGKIVLFVGRVNREKGIDLLIPAFTRVPDATLVLIGAVYEQRWLNRLLTKHGMGDRVVITGQLPPEQVAAGYASADVFAFPSLTDTQGLVLQEAALAGLPSVLADPALHQTGALGNATRLAEPTPESFGDALKRLLDNPQEARALGELARQRALAHTPARYAATMRDVYTLAASRTVATPDGDYFSS